MAGGQEIAAIIPIQDLRLLLRLEEELERIDIEDIRRARQDPANHQRVPLEQVKAEMGF